MNNHACITMNIPVLIAGISPLSSLMSGYHPTTTNCYNQSRWAIFTHVHWLYPHTSWQLFQTPNDSRINYLNLWLLLWMEEILHHLGWLKPYKIMGCLPSINWCRISQPSTVVLQNPAFQSIKSLPEHFRHRNRTEKVATSNSQTNPNIHRSSPS